MVNLLLGGKGTRKEYTMRDLTNQELDAICQAHEKWIQTEQKEGARADLSEANLEGRDLSGRDLSWADLSGAILRGADLSNTKLHHADITKADFYETKLQDADLLGLDIGALYLESAEREPGEALREYVDNGADETLYKWAEKTPHGQIRVAYYRKARSRYPGASFTRTITYNDLLDFLVDFDLSLGQAYAILGINLPKLSEEELFVLDALELMSQKERERALVSMMNVLPIWMLTARELEHPPSRRLLYYLQRKAPLDGLKISHASHRVKNTFKDRKFTTSFGLQGLSDACEWSHAPIWWVLNRPEISVYSDSPVVDQALAAFMLQPKERKPYFVKAFEALIREKGQYA